MSLTDAIQDVLSGNKNAYHRIVDETQDMLLTYASYRMGSLASCAEEVVQNTYIKAYNILEEFDISRDFNVWLRTLCYYQILSWKKTRQRERSRCASGMDALNEFAQEHDEDKDEHAWSESDIYSALRSCMGNLPERSQELLTRRYEENQSIEEIANALNKTKSWAATTIFRVRASIKKCIEKQNPEMKSHG